MNYTCDTLTKTQKPLVNIRAAMWSEVKIFSCAWTIHVINLSSCHPRCDKTREIHRPAKSEYCLKFSMLWTDCNHFMWVSWWKSIKKWRFSLILNTLLLICIGAFGDNDNDNDVDDDDNYGDNDHSHDNDDENDDGNDDDGNIHKRQGGLLASQWQMTQTRSSTCLSFGLSLSSFSNNNPALLLIINFFW